MTYRQSVPEYVRVCLQHYTRECRLCGSVNHVQIHHINGDHDDNRLENLVPLCADCHEEVHYGVSDDRQIRALRSMLPGEDYKGVNATTTVEFDESDEDTLIDVWEKADSGMIFEETYRKASPAESIRFACQEWIENC